MKRSFGHFILGIASIFIITTMEGCGIMRGVASTSYHAVTAPVRMIRQHTDRPAPGTRVVTHTTTTVTRTTRITTPLAAATPLPSPAKISSHPKQRRLAATSVSRAPTTPVPTRSYVEATGTKSQPKTSDDQAAKSHPQGQFPTATRVPDKPGYVISPFDPKKRYVDVSGYTPGSRVKDPWTDKIFIVP